MAGEGEDRVFEVEDDGTAVPLFGPPPIWIRVLTGLAGIAVWAGLVLAVFGGALAVGGALSWDWMWLGGWLALGGFLTVWLADRTMPWLLPRRRDDDDDLSSARQGGEDWASRCQPTGTVVPLPRPRARGATSQDRD